MAVHRTHILKAQFFKQNTVYQEVLKGILQLLHGFGNLAADSRNFFEEVLHIVLSLQIMTVRADFA
ncbi:hypothetical protein D3C75_1110250 [compost metagenome]